MAGYNVPATAAERLVDFTAIVEEFKNEYALLTEKQKKVSGHRARKSLLNISKLTRVMRKDVQDVIVSLSEKKEKVIEVKEPVVQTQEPVAEVQA